MIITSAGTVGKWLIKEGNKTYIMNIRRNICTCQRRNSRKQCKHLAFFNRNTTIKRGNLNANLPRLTIRKQVDRQDKEAKIKDTLKG